MGPIEVAIFAEHKTLISEGLNLTLQQIKEVKLCDIDFRDPLLHTIIKKESLKIVFFVVKNLDNSHYTEIIDLKKRSPSISILVISMQITKDSVFKGIRCGAQGFISADASPQEIREAIFTVRNGHDFYSSAITSLLVSNYTNLIRNEQNPKIKNVDKLSKRELEILSLWGEGLQNSEIAEKLFISIRTVETHKNNIMQKLGMHTTVDLIKFAIRNNLIRI
ncbi:MAG: response regulator transcription factor [Fibrobacter sp.]|jgi:DNA-binding NarL/FixJ family response regulator|nr:response regulator transcription factor [Fibrobacter sp.]